MRSLRTGADRLIAVITNVMHAATSSVAGRSRAFAILPAAGRSARMGRSKLLLPWGCHTVLAKVLAQWLNSGVARVVVVVHPDDTDLARIAAQAGADVVVPSQPPPQMLDSVRHGLARLKTESSPADSDLWLVSPADMPLITQDLIQAVLNHAAEHPGQIVRPVRAGKGGHPVAFPWTLANEVQAPIPEQGLNELVRRHGTCDLAWNNDNAFVDLDTPDDYSRWAPPGS